MDNRPISKALLPIDKDRPLEWLKIAPGGLFFNWLLCSGPGRQTNIRQTII
jgi:hypothetical protein